MRCEGWPNNVQVDAIRPLGPLHGVNHNAEVLVVAALPNEKSEGWLGGTWHAGRRLARMVDPVVHDSHAFFQLGIEKDQIVCSRLRNTEADISTNNALTFPLNLAFSPVATYAVKSLRN